MLPKISPIIPVRRSAVLDSADWLDELKYDGFRAVAYFDEGRCRLVSRKGNQFKKFDYLCRLMAKAIKAQDAVLDGEVVAIDETGLPAFNDVLKKKPTCQTAYFAFDLLWLKWA